MSDLDALIVDELRLAVPVTTTPDWEGVLQAARPRPRRRAVLAAVAFAAAAVVATALAAGLGHRFSSWLSGEPGVPAPTGLQHGFDIRNRAAYAGFPAGTKLRLLLSVRSAGTTFSLLGFRNGDAYCLRLVRADLPNGVGRNECLRAAELNDVPALVANDVRFTVGRPAQDVTGVYGFADDDTRSMVIRRQHGAAVVPVRDNVFLSLQAQPAGTVQHRPLPNPVLVVRARSKRGRTTLVPYVGADGFGIVAGGRPVAGPAYFGPATASAFPGPSKVEAPIANARIGWLDRREPRGKPLPPSASRGRHVFGRVIQPDPDDPTEVGVSIGANVLCQYDFNPLAGPSAGEACGPPFAQGPLMLGAWYSTPITHFHGVAADGITHVTAFLASGRVVQAALKDNVFMVAFPQAELPGRIVGYDTHNRVAGIVVLPGNAVMQPCPLARFAAPVDRLPASQPWERLDLATLTVNGARILGRSPAEVEAALGRPTLVRPRNEVVNGVPVPAFRYGGTTQATMGLQVTFVKHGSKIAARDLYYGSASLVDAKLGHILRMDPRVLEQRIDQTYAADYTTRVAYGSQPQLGCVATIGRRQAAGGITLGIDPYRPSHPYLDITSGTLP